MGATGEHIAHSLNQGPHVGPWDPPADYEKGPTMHDYTYTTADGLHMKRVNRRTARRLHRQGLEICAAPCNLRPDSPWGAAFTLRASEDFERFENAATWYNCADSETGRYLAWYAPAVKIPRNFRYVGRGRLDGILGTMYHLDALEDSERAAAEAAGARVTSWQYRYAPELKGPALFVPDSALRY